MKDDMLFQANSAVLKPEDLKLLEFLGYAVKSVQDEAAMIAVIGHTAAVPGSPDYSVSDRILSSSRANTVLMYLEDEIGIQPEKLISVGWGKNSPVASNDTSEGRARNRRVEILISGKNVLQEQLENIYEELS